MFEISSSPVSAVIVTHCGDVGSGVRDEDLRPVDDPVSVPELRRRPRRACVGPGSRLGQAECGEPRTGGERRQPFLSLCIGAEQEDRHRAERRVGGDRDRHRRVDPCQLLDRDRIRQGVAACTAELLGKRDPHQPQLGHLGDELGREAAVAVEFLWREVRDASGQTTARCRGRAHAPARDRDPRGAMVPTRMRLEPHPRRAQRPVVSGRARRDRQAGDEHALRVTSRRRFRLGQRACAAAVSSDKFDLSYTARRGPDAVRTALVLARAAVVRVSGFGPSWSAVAPARRARLWRRSDSGLRQSPRATRYSSRSCSCPASALPRFTRRERSSPRSRADVSGRAGCLCSTSGATPGMPWVPSS